jgi:hypothetical protein
MRAPDAAQSIDERARACAREPRRRLTKTSLSASCFFR